MSGASLRPGELRLVHHHPGRLRLRSSALLGTGELPARLHDTLLAEKLARTVTHDPRTGSVVIDYEPGAAEPDTLARRAAEVLGLPLVTAFADRDERFHGERFVAACRQLNETAQQITGSRLELRTLAPAALMGLSVTLLIFGRGPRLPRWDSLAYWSVTIFAMLHGREISGAPRPAGERAGRPG